MSKYIHAILKYSGGKYNELPTIMNNLPKHINNYYEPFVGGGAVWLNMNLANHCYVNDFSKDLMRLYKLVQEKNPEFIKFVTNISKAWQMPYATKILKPAKNVSTTAYLEKALPYLVQSVSFLHDSSDSIKKRFTRTVTNKIKRLKRKAKKEHRPVDNIKGTYLTATKATLYDLLRSKYNTTKNPLVHTGTYWFLREYGYSSMFRFNRNGDFNIPYGGESYNNKDIINKLNASLGNPVQKILQMTTLSNNDFQKFLEKYCPITNDFCFLDPPYDTKFSSYDRNSFGVKDQKRLAHFVKNHLHCHWMMMIQETPLMDELYKNGESIDHGKNRLYISLMGKKYLINFKNRNLNTQKTKYMVITNYPIAFNKQTSLF